MKSSIKALKAAFPLTIPVFFGYLFLGFGFGVLLAKAGFNFLLAPFSALTVYSGSLQYAEVDLIKSDFSVLSAIVVAIAINVRHIFYGLSIIEQYNRIGKYKFYCIFGLTDETFSLVVSQKAPKDVHEGKFYLFITLLNHMYWIFGCTLGGLFGQFVEFNSKGIEFVMTALFVVIFLEQWESTKNHQPALIGLVCSIIPLVIIKVFFPQLISYFLIFVLSMIFIVLTVVKKPLQRRLK